jgi:hypothetical protein
MMLQFTVANSHVCRDVAYLRFWFIIDKPQQPFQFSIKRGSRKQQ